VYTQIRILNTQYILINSLAKILDRKPPDFDMHQYIAKNSR